MEKARVTLVGSLSLAVGRYRFLKDRAVIVTDKELLKYVKGNPSFRVEPMATPVNNEPAKEAQKRPLAKKQPTEEKSEGGKAPLKKLRRPAKNGEDGAS